MMKTKMMKTKMMKQMMMLASFTCFAVMAARCANPSVLSIQPEAGAMKVLFIGSSYFSANDLPVIFAEMAVAGGKTLFWDVSIKDGEYLDYHASNKKTLKKINGYDWDVVILQGVCTNVAYPENHAVIFPPHESHPVKPAIRTLMNAIHENHSKTRVLFCMPWAFEDGTTWIQGQDETYERLQIMVYHNTLLFSEELGFQVAPVGWAWYHAIQNCPGIKLFQLDYNHPAITGSYLTACVLYVSIFIETVEGNSLSICRDEELLAYLQSIATSTVLEDLELWGLSESASL